SLDNRPTCIKVEGLPSTAGEAELRAHCGIVGSVEAIAMLPLGSSGRIGVAGVVKFGDRRYDVGSG
ncbi:unnamed protein product, partial [Choristocarpus tenellus]